MWRGRLVTIRWSKGRARATRWWHEEAFVAVFTCVMAKVIEETNGFVCDIWTRPRCDSGHWVPPAVKAINVAGLKLNCLKDVAFA